MDRNLAGAFESPGVTTSSGVVALVGRVLLLATLPLSVIWIPVGAIPSVGTVAASDVALLGLWVITGLACVLNRCADLGYRAVLLVLLAIGIGGLAAIGSELNSPAGRGALEFMLFMKRFGLASILPAAATLFRSRGMGTWARALSSCALAGLVAFVLFPDLQNILPRPSAWDPVELEGRATGPLTNPNDLAYAAVALAVLHSALLPPKSSAIARTLLVATLAGSATCLVLSGSRSGVLGAAGALLFILVYPGMRLPTRAALMSAAGLSLAAGLASSAIFRERLGSAYRHGLGDENVYSRLEAQWLAIRTAWSHPFGVGYTGFARAAARETPHVTLVTSDSVYCDTLLGAGVLGLICFLWLLLTAWRYVECARARGDPGVRVLKAGLVAFMLFGTATVVPVSVFLSPLFFCLASAAAYLNANTQ